MSASHRADSSIGRTLRTDSSALPAARFGGATGRSEQPSADAGPVTIVVMDVGPMGGMERQLTEIIAGILRAGRRVTVVSRTCDIPPHPNLRWIRVPGPRRPYSITLPLFVVLASLRVWRWRDGLVHTNGATVLNRADVSTLHFCHHAFQSRFAASDRGRRGVAYRLNSLAFARVNSALERFCMRPSRTGHLICISEGVAREAREFFDGYDARVDVIPYGVDSTRFRPDPSARRLVRGELGVSDAQLLAAFVGGEWERKGLATAIQGIAARPEWQIVVVGEGDEPRYRALAADAGAEDRVRFVGRDPHPERIYAAADAFVFPTLYETFSLVAHEAAAAGLPLLAGNVSGIEDLVTPGANGWFISRDPDELAEHLRTLGSDPDMRRRMGEAARRSAQPYQWQRAAAAHLKLYERLEAVAIGSGRG